ncbi:cellulose biosynthesis protein BcsG [uncultured Sutterella sp.]|uniref:cellulose biosynthesis protein BcsG n=1 Tax=uncultured Sutterella sp. TaxID=286133 RepID=UPI00260409FA|nr:cellulose biosynthesis protein BcsG [uncultured Sutterella sp.]
MTQLSPNSSFSGGSRGAGIWNLYFIGKFILLWLSYIQLKPIENAALLALILIPIRSLILRRIRAAAAFAAAFALLWSESWLPGPDAIIRNLGNLADFSPAYLLELASSAINIEMVEIAFAACIVWMLLRNWIRFTVFTIAGLIFFSLPNWRTFIDSDKAEAPQEAAAEAATAATPAPTPAQAAAGPLPPQTEPADDAGINRWLARFYQSESERKAGIPQESRPRDFDIAVVNICSMSTDDLEASDLADHPVFSRFDARFENFNSATTYSGPATLRLLRSVCGEPSHEVLYNHREPSCELFGRLEQAGWKTTFFMDHNGQFDGYLDSLRERAGFAAKLSDQSSYRQALAAFDDSKIYRTADVLRDWLRHKPADGAPTAAFFNLIALHDGNRALKSTRPMPFKPRAETLLNDLSQVMSEIEASGRKVLFIIVPEHGAAVRGDKIQMARLREIPSPRITHVPVLVKFFGLPKEALPGTQIRIPESTSYLAVSELIGRTAACDPWSAATTCPGPQELFKGLPQTWAVSENSNASVLSYQNKWWVKLPGDKWIAYPGM